MNSGVWWRVGFLIGVTLGAVLLLLLVLWVRPIVIVIPAGPPATPATDQGERMTLYAANGTQLTKTAAAAKVTAVPVTDPIVRVGENLYEGERLDGTTFPEGKRKLRFPSGALIRQSQLDACFPDATVTDVAPATGAAAGNTLVTVRGTNFTPGSTVTFGGTAATSVTVINETTLTCRTPARAAGATAVAVTTDAGAATKANAFTYA
ncbi:IPT/TIG domain-containing protein [Planomonospora sp. ID82291]|uniref:IPT/TIG domain-containing protein n=1 Tax=Planomonospora sp. ID82291 TaxID=2738136 RepID=UPI0018C407A5|nr:IPT/TIG domain-containing protein [Planomonospora sp. ID82291]MBG0818975.1 IPT/TIG domain-containing protein [Planomonospora sp. ID82291]